ncbi:TPA: hypothetical protein ACRSAD_005049, partial [Klebsiella quasipneumoniae]
WKTECRKINRERNLPGINIEVVALLSAARAGKYSVVPLFRRVAAVALPGLRSYDLSLIYSPLLLKLPVLTASTSLRRSRQAGWRYKCLIRPTRSLRQRRANVA